MTRGLMFVAGWLVAAAVTVSAAGCGAAPGRTQPPPAAAAEPVRLNVLTYNIHHAQGTDQKLDLDRIAAVIRRTEADLVALQEVDSHTKRVPGVDQAAELGRLTNMHAFFGPAMDYQGGKYGDAVLSRFPISRSRVIQLPHVPGGRREPRVAAATTCALPDKSAIVFVSTHWDHTGPSNDRLAQAKGTNEALAAETLPVILAGDFNCEPGSPPMAELEQQWQLASGAAASFPAANPAKSIDHVLVKPAGRWRVVETKVIEEPVASDHAPVLVKLELLPAK